jgi:hypothetical protein
MYKLTCFVVVKLSEVSVHKARDTCITLWAQNTNDDTDRPKSDAVKVNFLKPVADHSVLDEKRTEDATEDWRCVT